MITAEEMVQKLVGVEPDSLLFISYKAGRPPTKRAIREAKKASDEGYVRRWFVGRFVSQFTSKKGDPILTVFTETRYNEMKPTENGHFRSFNANLGQLLAIEVIK